MHSHQSTKQNQPQLQVEMAVSSLPKMLSLLILLACPNYLTGASITLEDNLQQLADNYKLMEHKMNQMESKNNELESQFQHFREEFTAKINQLESKVQEQERLLMALQSPSSLKSIQLKSNDEAYGQSKAMPTSCEDLRVIGHIWSGLYSVMGTKMVKSVYCDFTKQFTDPSFEQLLGNVDIKSTSAHFYAQRNADGFAQTNTPIMFETIILNDGGSYNSGTGRFTAPVGGKYFFSFTGLVKFPAYSYLIRTDIGLYKNNAPVGYSQADEVVNSGFQYETISLQSTLELVKGDQIWVAISTISSGVTLEGNAYTHFNGFLLEQTLF